MDFDDKTKAVINKTIDEILTTCKYLPLPETATLVAEDIDKKLKGLIKEKYKVSVCLHTPEKGASSIMANVNLSA